jgi:hypothetical protein
LIQFLTKMADKVTYMHIYWKLEKSRVLNIIERLQIPHILEICYLYNLQLKLYYVKNIYQSRHRFLLFVPSVPNAQLKKVLVSKQFP